MKVLIADADTDEVTPLRQRLASVPNSIVETASCGTDAWMILTTFHEGFDAAVVDFSLPDMHGLELLRKIRRRPALMQLPVVVCTSIHDRRTVIDAMGLGVKHYLVKPATPETVYARLVDVISGAPRI